MSYETCVGVDHYLKDELLELVKKKDRYSVLEDGWYERLVHHSSCFGYRGSQSVFTIQVEGTPSRATLIWHKDHDTIIYSIGVHDKHHIVKKIEKGDWSMRFSRLSTIMQTFMDHHKIKAGAQAKFLLPDV